MAKNVVIVQPWFTATGHPAQSLVNTAMALRGVDGLRYLVSVERGRSGSQLRDVRQVAEIESFNVNSPSLREGTLKALFWLCLQARRGQRADHVFFFDAHLVLLATLWKAFYLYLKPERLSLIYLMGPERVMRSYIATRLVKRFLHRPEVTLYVRTEELAAAWHAAFATVPLSRIRYLPSLELPEDGTVIELPVFEARLKFGVLGQVRRGKGLDWLVPMFQREPELGDLAVAGAFNNPQDAEALSFLHGFAGFRNEYLSGDVMLKVAREQHYLLMLYDDWDARMESAVLYLAARAGRPVIAYDRGWCGRQIRTFGNGFLVGSERAELTQLIKALPKPGSVEYKGLLEGVGRFREAHSAMRLRERYLQELTADVSG